MTHEELKKAYRKMLIDAGVSERQLAESLGVSSQSLNQKMNRGSIKLLEFADLINRLGFEMKFEEFSPKNKQ